MKKTILLTAAAAITLAAAMTACGNGKKTAASTPDPEIEATSTLPVTANAITDTTLTISGREMPFTLVERIYQADDDGLFYLAASAMVPAGESAVTPTVSSLIDYTYALLGIPAIDTVEPVNTPLALAARLDTLGTAFVDFATPLAADTSEFATPGYMMSIVLQPVYADDSILTYSVVADTFTGGNAPDYNEYVLSLDHATGAVLNLDDLVGPDARNQVVDSLISNIAESNGKSVDEYLSDMRLFLSFTSPITADNFPVYYVALTPDGILFTYPKYSIAPGSYGSPRYLVPYPAN